MFLKVVDSSLLKMDQFPCQVEIDKIVGYKIDFSENDENINCIYNSFDENYSALKKDFKKYENLFNGELGTYKYENIDLKLKPNLKPIFSKPRPVPFLLRKERKKIRSLMI